jgi:hypothetical protein
VAKAKLPKQLRERIKLLFRQGHTNAEIYDLVKAEGEDYVDSGKELMRCIIAIKGKLKDAASVSKGLPKPKSFDAEKHKEVISKIYQGMPGKELEDLCRDIVVDILLNYEGFEGVIKGPDLKGTPFDFFGFKDGDPYVIEFKGSWNRFNLPFETQRIRLRELLERIDGLQGSLIQVSVNKEQYRILYNEALYNLFFYPRVPLKPVEDWIRERM